MTEKHPAFWEHPLLDLQKLKAEIQAIINRAHYDSKNGVESLKDDVSTIKKT